MKSSLLFLVAALGVPVVAEDFVWIEAESLESPPAPAEATGWAMPEYVSGEVLAVQLSDKEAERLPADGLVLAYPFEAPAAGSFEIWNRVGFENIRSPFRWRVDDGEWVENSQEGQPITNVQELAFWNPMGWTRLGEVELTAGSHTLEIRIDRQSTTDNEGNTKPAQTRYVSDALAIVKPGWQPNFKHRPDWKPEEAIDREAREQVFGWEDDGEPRQAVVLNGAWEYAPWDEVGEISEEQRIGGAEALPDLGRLSWYGIEVPSNRNQVRPEFTHNHRAIYRTRVEVPEAFAGRRMHLNFEAINLMANLFVNGERVGDFDVVYGQWRPEVTEFIKPGEVNEIAVVIKDPFYALTPEGETGIRRSQYFPMSLFHRNQGVTMRFDYPVKGATQVGLVDEVTLIATGSAYVEDVFVKPFPVTRGELEIDVTLGGRVFGDTVVLRNRIEPWQGTAEGTRELKETAVTMAAGAESKVTLTTPSEGLDEWWLFDPKLYQLVTEVVAGGRVIDRVSTRFGVREWEQRGNQFYLNGVRQHLRADLTHYGVREGEDLEQVVADWQENGTNVFRLRFQWPWAGMTPRQVLAWCDEQGVPVRKNAGTFDGQHASYRLALKDGDTKTSNGALFENWRRQMLNRAKARRNHPSVWIWELDNEIVYINGRNFGNLDVVEPEFRETSEALMAMDPTRATITGGGNALMDESLPTYGPHYFEVDDREYPDEAYTLEQSLARQGTGEAGKVWPLDFDKMPTFLSETAFLPGRDPASFAQVGGEVAFLGKREAKPAIGKIASWLAAGYRWAEMGGTHFWFSKSFTDGSYVHAWQPVAALVRQWDWSFGPGEEVVRDLKIFNDTRDESPITVSWAYRVGDEVMAEGSEEFEVEAGGDAMWQVKFTTPQRVTGRNATEYVVTATRGGETLYEHSHPGALLPRPELTREPLKFDGKLVVWDPQGEAAAALEQRGAEFERVAGIDAIPADFGMLVVGRDAIGPKAATDRRWLQWVSEGRKVLVLEQEHSLHYQALAADLEPSEHDGRIAFSQDLSHPVFAGLARDDLSFWSGDHVVYKNIYQKATRGARSLVHADTKLNYSALSFAPVEDGAFLLSQLVVGEKLGSEVVARTLFHNMVDFLAGWEPVRRPAAVVAEEGAPASEALEAVGLQFERRDDPVAALGDEEVEILIVDADEQALAKLAAATGEIERFQARGGWLVVLGVTPETLEEFNRIVGVDHLIRPFEMERVQFPAVRDPLTAGLSLRDVVMTSGERIQVQSRDEWPADDAFGYILDLDDIAPFSEFPPPAYWGNPEQTGPGRDTWPRNMVNGFLADTHWRVIFSIHLNADDPTSWTIELPREEEITGLTMVPNTIYHRITALELSFDGDEGSTKRFEIEEDSDRIQVQFEPVKAKRLTIDITDWDESGRSDVIGVDNLWIRVARPDDWSERVKPLLNIGGLIKYPRGEGGVLLSQYALLENESNPINAEKKRTVLSTLLRNLGGIFSGGGAVVVGENLRYQPVSLEQQCNLYLSRESGWPLREADLSGLPLGERTFDGVPFAIRDFETSPLENAVTLAANRPKTGIDAKQVGGIEVGRKADALFFLHTFLQGREWQESRREPQPPVVFEYVVSYGDGSEAVVPVRLESGVRDWLGEGTPTNLREASVAWTGEVGEDGAKQATVYRMQWTNPYPERVIESVALRYGEAGDRYGAPVLLGVTTAVAAE